MRQFVDWYMNDALWFTITNIAGIGAIGFVISGIFIFFKD